MRFIRPRVRRDLTFQIARAFTNAVLTMLTCDYNDWHYYGLQALCGLHDLRAIVLLRETSMH